RRRRLALTLPETLIEAETVRQHKRAVVIGIIVQVIVCYRSLRRNSDQRRVRVNHACCRKEARLRDAPHTNLARVARDVLDQPFDGVVTVGTFVCVLWPFHRFVRADDREIAFAHEAATHVLIDEDELLASEERGRPDTRTILV